MALLYISANLFNTWFNRRVLDSHFCLCILHWTFMREREQKWVMSIQCPESEATGVDLSWDNQTYAKRTGWKQVLWCSWSPIYGISEGQWRLLPGTAWPLCRQVNCRNSLLLHQEAPIKVVNLDTEVLNWNPQSVVLPFYCLSITGLKNCFLLGGSFRFPLLPTSYSKALRISSGVYWSRLSFFASFLYSVF